LENIEEISMEYLPQNCIPNAAVICHQRMANNDHFQPQQHLPDITWASFHIILWLCTLLGWNISNILCNILPPSLPWVWHICLVALLIPQGYTQSAYFKIPQVHTIPVYHS